MNLVRVTNGLAIIASVALMSCNSSKNETPSSPGEQDTVVVTGNADTTLITRNTRVVITREEVPSGVTAAFSKKEPKAVNVQYAKLQKPGVTAADTVTYYYIDYDRDNYGYWLVYDTEGNLVEDNSFVKIDGLPDPVSRAISEYFPGYKVVETDKENDKDIVMYEVELHRGEMKRKVKFLADGGIYKLK